MQTQLTRTLAQSSCHVQMDYFELSAFHMNRILQKCHLAFKHIDFLMAYLAEQILALLLSVTGCELHSCFVPQAVAYVQNVTGF
jgi:hypothetical protein